MGIINMNDIAIYGAGGFGREVACLINWINSINHQWNIIGFFDDLIEENTQISHFGKVIGGIEALNSYNKQLSVVIAVGNPKAIFAILNSINNPLIRFPNIIAPDFIIKDDSTFSIGYGNLIQSGCKVSCDVQIGNFNVFNVDIGIGHDVKIGNYNVLMPSVKVSGAVNIGDTNFFGVGSIVLQQIIIRNNIRLGAGSVLMTKPKEGYTYIGIPAKIIEF
jgi:sugar O-acyltransferase (sialic acid O-acetyltransferase NeuD family)